MWKAAEMASWRMSGPTSAEAATGEPAWAAAYAACCLTVGCQGRHRSLRRRLRGRCGKEQTSFRAKVPLVDYGAAEIERRRPALRTRDCRTRRRRLRRSTPMKETRLS